MTMLPANYLPESYSDVTNDFAAEVSATLRPRVLQPAAKRATFNPFSYTVARVNNLLQALVNLFYLVARETCLEPRLRPLITQIQAELAQLSQWHNQLGSQVARPDLEKEQ